MSEISLFALTDARLTDIGTQINKLYSAWNQFSGFQDEYDRGFKDGQDAATEQWKEKWDRKVADFCRLETDLQTTQLEKIKLSDQLKIKPRRSNKKQPGDSQQLKDLQKQILKLQKSQKEMEQRHRKSIENLEKKWKNKEKRLKQKHLQEMQHTIQGHEEVVKDFVESAAKDADDMRASHQQISKKLRQKLAAAQNRCRIWKRKHMIIKKNAEQALKMCREIDNGK